MKFTEDHPHVSINESGLQGWDEFDKWARYNLTLWNYANEEAEFAKLSEVDKLRFLSYLYAMQYERRTREFCDYQLRNPAPVMGPDGLVYRYVGP